MATLDSILTFIGSAGELSAYRRRDLDKIIVRKKGGPSRRQIKTSPNFEKVRRYNAEFGGRATLAGTIVAGLKPLKPVINHNLHAAFNARLKPIQQADNESTLGQRKVMLSRNPKLLEGFSLTRSRILESLISVPLIGSIDKEQHSAVLHIPAMIPNVNFHTLTNYPYFKVSATLSFVPDAVFKDNRYQLEGITSRNNLYTVQETPWTQCSAGLQPKTMSLNLPFQPTATFSLMLTVGLLFGTLSEAETIEAVRYAGSGKVIACV